MIKFVNNKGKKNKITSGDNSPIVEINSSQTIKESQIIKGDSNTVTKGDGNTIIKGDLNQTINIENPPENQEFSKSENIDFLPEDIGSHINSLPLYDQENAYEKFIGASFEWLLRIESTSKRKTKGELDNLTFSSMTGTGFPLITCSADLNKFDHVKRSNKLDEFVVLGTIVKISWTSIEVNVHDFCFGLPWSSGLFSVFFIHRKPLYPNTRPKLSGNEIFLHKQCFGSPCGSVRP